MFGIPVALEMDSDESSNSTPVRLTRWFYKPRKNNLVRSEWILTCLTISKTISIPDIGEIWFKQKKLDLSYYEPNLKPRCQKGCKAIFPFSHLLERYSLLMRQIIRYFTCEGRYSRIYSYHIRLLIHFTKVKIMNLPYYLFWSIDKMASLVKKISYDRQMPSLFH